MIQNKEIEEILDRGSFFPYNSSIAKIMLVRAGKKNLHISHTKLHRLLWILEVAHIALLDKELLNEPFQAWTAGPIHPYLFLYISTVCPNLKAGNIDLVSLCQKETLFKNIPVKQSLNQDSLAIMDRVISVYGKEENSTLFHLLTKEDNCFSQPWKICRDKRYLNPIPSFLIRKQVNEPDEKLKELVKPFVEPTTHTESARSSSLTSSLHAGWKKFVKKCKGNSPREKQ